MKNTDSKNPKKNSLMRRRRASYPALKLWEAVRIERAECGINRGLHGRRAPANLNGTGKSVVLRGCFIFCRLTLRPGRSRYAPHVGKKQLARKERHG